MELVDKEECFEEIIKGETLEVLNVDKLNQLHPYISEIITYFLSKARNDRRPKRNDLVPSEVVHLIPYIAILEPRYEGDELLDLNVRLMGTEMVKLYGENTGKMLSDFTNKTVSKRVFETCDLVVKNKSIVVGTVSSFDKDRSYLKILKTMIPLFDDEHNPDRVTQIISLIVSGS